MSALISAMAFSWSGGLFKGETGLKFLLPVGIRCKGMARRDFPLGIQPQQFRGQDGDGLLGLPGGLLPVLAAHVGQVGGCPFIADVFVQQSHLFHRHMELVPFGILQLQIIPMHPVDFNGFHAHVPADALYVVDHVISHLDVGEVVQGRPFSLLSGQ